MKIRQNAAYSIIQLKQDSRLLIPPLGVRGLFGA